MPWLCRARTCGFVIRIVGIRGKTAFRLGILDIVKVGLFVPGPTFVPTLGE
jgi:hypothetical protein